MRICICKIHSLGSSWSRDLAGLLDDLADSFQQPTCLTFSIKNNCSHFVFISKAKFSLQFVNFVYCACVSISRRLCACMCVRVYMCVCVSVRVCVGMEMETHWPDHWFSIELKRYTGKVSLQLKAITACWAGSYRVSLSINNVNMTLPVWRYFLLLIVKYVSLS